MRSANIPGRFVPKSEETEFLFSHLVNLKQRAFLSAYSAVGTLTGASKIADVSTSSHRKWMKEDPVYAEAFKTAHDSAGDSLEEELRRRAFAGSDLLGIFILKGFKPEKYRENVKIEHANLPDSVLDARIFELARKGGIPFSASGEGAALRGTNGSSESH